MDDILPRLLPRAFFARDAATVARALLGKTLVASGRAAPGNSVTTAASPDVRALRITETEAYVGTFDLASHARVGPTRRNRAMFGPPGHAYVYLIYGMHPMLNVVTSPPGDAQAVLIRAGRPMPRATGTEGDDAQGACAQGPPRIPPSRPLRGPGLVARHLGITLSMDGHDLRRPPLQLLDGPAPDEVRITPRIGVQYARHWATAPLRFVADDW